METIGEKDTKVNFLDKVYNSILTEREFIRLLLAYMNKLGVREITEEELSKKLFPYYKDHNYSILFEDITKDRYCDQVNIRDAMYGEKWFSGGCIIWVSNNPSRLCLHYGKGFDTSIHEKDLSPEIIALLKSIARDLAIRNKFESPRLNIYGYDPNRNYSILSANHRGHSYGFELITDGDIKSIGEIKWAPHVYYPDPSGSSEDRQYNRGGIFKHATLENASYAILQGTCEGVIKKVDIFTRIVEEKQLERILEFANQLHEDESSLLVGEKPYVRRLTLD